MFWVISVYFNLRNILPNLAHSSRDTLYVCMYVYIYIYIYIYTHTHTLIMSHNGVVSVELIGGMFYFALIFNFPVAILMLKTAGWGSAGSSACSSNYLSIISPMYL